MQTTYILSKPLFINKGDDINFLLQKAVQAGDAKIVADPLSLELIRRGWSRDWNADVWYRADEDPECGFYTMDWALAKEGM